MEILIVVAALAILAWASLRYGYDSRDLGIGKGI